MVLSVGIGYVLLVTPAVAGEILSGGAQAPVVITVTSRGPNLDPADIDALTRALPAAVVVSRDLAPESIPIAGASTPLDVESVDSAFFDVYGLNLVSGTLFTPADDLRAAPVAIIGQQVAQSLFGSATAATGKSLRVRNVSLTVIGVLAPSDDPNLAGFSQRVFVPLQTGRIRLVGAQAPTQLAIGTTTAATASNLAASATQVLRQRYPTAISAFSVQTHVESWAPEAIPALFTQAASRVHTEFLQAKGLYTPRARP